MAKKNLGDIEDNNKNLGGVSALFNSPSKEILTKAGKPEAVAEEETVTYPLRLKKSSLKALKILAAQRRCYGKRIDSFRSRQSLRPINLVKKNADV